MMVFHAPFGRPYASKSALMMALALGSSTSFAAQPPSPPPSIRPHPTSIPVQAVKSPKGISTWMVESKEIPVVSVSLAFKNAGSIADPKGLAGLTQLLSGLLDEGAGEWDSQAFKTVLLEKNIELSIAANQDTFHISFRTVKENADEAFRVLHTLLTRPRFAVDALNRVKNQIRTILEQSLHNETVMGEETLRSLVYGDHPYGKTTRQVLKEFPAITADHLRQFMKERFTRDHLIIAVVGDITPEQVQTALDKTFGDLAEKASPLSVTEASLAHQGTTTVVPLDIPQSVIFFLQPGLPRSHPDFYAAFVFMKILGDGQFESRLWNEVREKRGLAYGIDASLSWAQHSHTVLGRTATKNESASKVITLIREVWQGAAQGVTQAELDFVKERMMGSFALNFSATSRIAAALLTYQIDNLGIDFINKRNEIIASLTLDQINKVAKTLLTPDRLTFVVVGKPEGLQTVQNEKSGVNHP